MKLLRLMAVVVLACPCSTGCAPEDEGVHSAGPGFPEAGAGGGDAGVSSDGGNWWFDASVGTPEGGVIVIPGDDGGCGAVKAQTEPVKAPVDVVWVLDNSGSMNDEITNVMANMAAFIDGIKASGNVSVSTLTGGFSGFLQLAFVNPNYRWLSTEVGSWNSFEVLLNNYNGGVRWSQHLRPTAPLHIVIVTDDASIPMKAPEFLQKMMALTGKPFVVHAIAAQGLGGGNCSGAGPGTEYFNAAMSTAGEQLSICGNFAEGMKKIQTSVTNSVPLPCDYTIPPSPDGQALDPEAVAVVYTPTGGSDMEFAKASTSNVCADNVAWHFDDESAPSKVVMCPAACEVVKAGGAISIGFGCAPSVVLE